MPKRKLNQQIPEIPLIEVATRAIRTNRFQKFAKAFSQAPRELSQMRNKKGYTLIQEAIHQDNKRIFNHILRFNVDLDTVNLQDETALLYVVNEIGDRGEYYLSELIKKGSTLHSGHSVQLLFSCIDNSAINILKHLLDKGVDVNGRDENECTALYKVLEKRVNYRDEFITTLLCYNIDTSVKPTYSSYNAFECSIQSTDSSIQEVLFYYMYDQHTDCEIHFSALLHLAKLESPLFHMIFHYGVRIILDSDDKNFQRYFEVLCCIDMVYLEILLQRCHACICEVTKGVDLYNWDSPKKYKLLTTVHALTKISMLLESSASMTCFMMDYIYAMNCDTVLIYVSFFNKIITTKLVIYMILYGLEINRDFLDRIFEIYGYGDLFKFLLHVDYKGQDTSRPKNVLVSLIVDKDVDLNTILEKPDEYSLNGVDELVHFVAHPKLCQFVLDNPRNWLLSTTRIQAIMDYPKIPLLMDIARNVCRKYIWNAFNVKSTKQFYCIVNGLPIGVGYKKIITFEAKLY